VKKREMSVILEIVIVPCRTRKGSEIGNGCLEYDTIKVIKKSAYAMNRFGGYGRK